MYNKDMSYSTDNTIDLVKQWGRDRNITDFHAQLNKVIEEVGEIAHEITRNRCGDELIDALGDATVTLIVLADICGFDIRTCLDAAYNEIKDRKGATKGAFIKND